VHPLQEEDDDDEAEEVGKSLSERVDLKPQRDIRRPTFSLSQEGQAGHSSPKTSFSNSCPHASHRYS
jgi:hypothetical protein